MASALGSLLANYTDSEGEEEIKEDDDEKDSDNDSVNLNPTLAERLGRERTPSGTPGSSASGKSASTPVKAAKAKLVSYHDPDAGLSDEEREPVPMELESEDEDKENEAELHDEKESIDMETEEKERSHIMEELWLEGVKLPPEPPGQCSKELQGVLCTPLSPLQEEPLWW